MAVKKGHDFYFELILNLESVEDSKYYNNCLKLIISRYLGARILVNAPQSTKYQYRGSFIVCIRTKVVILPNFLIMCTFKLVNPPVQTGIAIIDNCDSFRPFRTNHLPTKSGICGPKWYIWLRNESDLCSNFRQITRLFWSNRNYEMSGNVEFPQVSHSFCTEGYLQWPKVTLG